MIILVGGEKGGTGKTTLAISLAALRTKDGKDVLLIDTDRQSSALYWSQKRTEAGHSPRIPCVQLFGKGLQNEVLDLAKRYDDLVLDAGGRDSVELRAGLIVAEKAYIPVQASQFDVWTLDRAEELVSTAQTFNPGLLAFVIINRASANPGVTEVKEAKELLQDFEHLRLAQSIIRDRIAYRKSAREGLCATELQPPDGKATQELSSFYVEAFNI
jgi:chromosome partitioning protein